MLLKLIESFERSVGDPIALFSSLLSILACEVGEGILTRQIPIRGESPLTLGAIDSVQVL
jgi:hypothetical protein